MAATPVSASSQSGFRIGIDLGGFKIEGIDGATEKAHIVFGAILGTGCGGGIVVDGKLLNGPRSIAGEWGHKPLPWATPEEYPGPQCWCGRKGCLETWLSGPGMAADHSRATGEKLTPLEISDRAKQGNKPARATLTRHVHRLARGLAHVVNILDPDVIVLGGGLSQLSHLYEELPLLIGPHIFADRGSAVVRPSKWGSTRGVRGAARCGIFLALLSDDSVSGVSSRKPGFIEIRRAMSALGH